MNNPCVFFKLYGKWLSVEPKVHQRVDKVFFQKKRKSLIAGGRQFFGITYVHRIEGFMNTMEQ